MKIKDSYLISASVLMFLLITLNVFSSPFKFKSILSIDGSIYSRDTLPTDYNFRNRDRVAFIGNSITHGGYFHSILYLFYMTRYPEMTFDFFNCGVSGDRAMDAINRFKGDILSHNPNVCFIKMGMNDAGIGLNGTLEEQQKGQDLYKHDMDSLIRLCITTESKIILVSPSIYDQTVKASSVNLNKNNRLKTFTKVLDSLSRKYQTGFIDLNSFMDSINRSRQKDKPAFSLINSDRTHPNYDGHFVMAFSILNKLSPVSMVSDIAVNGINHSILKQINCSVRQVELSNGVINFRCKENALPFPIVAYPSDSTLVPFTRKFNQEILQVTGLAPDNNYKLEIDDQLIGVFSGKQFSDGINLAILLNTPQSQQSYHLYKLNQERFSITQQLRDMKYVETKILRGAEIQGNLTKVMNQKLDLDKSKPWFDYNKRLADFYLLNWTKTDQLKKKILQLEKRMGTINKPIEHFYRIYK